MKLKVFKRIRRFLAAYPRLRAILIFMGIIAIISVVASRMSHTPPPEATGKSFSSAPSGSVKGKATPYRSKKYDSMQSKDEKMRLDHSIKSGKTVLENSTKVINVNKNQQNDASDYVDNTPTLTTSQKRIASITGSRTYLDMAKRQEARKNYASLQQDEKARKESYNMKVSNTVNRMNSQLNSLNKSFSTVTPQVTVSAKVVAVASSSGAGKSSTKAVAVKSGAVVFAVLDTQLNSDQPGTPVMATVIQGQFKDAKLLGSFVRQDEKLVIKFNKMSLPSLPSSISINAYAINATTAQNALASDVDNHYLLRYGSLFASAFLQGFGEYYTETSDNTCNGASTCIVTGDNDGSSDTEQTSKKAMYSGLGQVGEVLAKKASDQFNRPPTVTLNQGVGMGILFMSDVRI